MGALNDKYIAANKRNSDGRYCYVGESGGIQISCSGFTKLNMFESGVITEAEKNDHNSFWAGDGIVGILADTKRFRRHEKTETPQNGWLQWFEGHISTYYDGGCFEASPKKSHYLAKNGKTAVGYFPQNHNCSGGKLLCYYEILDKEDNKLFTQETIEIAVKHGLEIANNDRHGYSNEVGSNLGQDFGQPDYDCGAFVSESWRYAGVLPKGVVFEPNQPNGQWGYDVILSQAGFVKLPFVYSNVKRGDVLIRDGKHTELATSPTTTVGAHSSKDGGIPGDTYGNEISEVALSKDWTYIYRLPVENPTPTIKEGSTGSAVKKLQELLNAKMNAGLGVDGSFGPKTLEAVKKYQTSVDLYADGIVGPKTWEKLLAEEPKTEPEKLSASGILDVAKEIVEGKGNWGFYPDRKVKLTEKYGEATAKKIQDIINIAAT